MQKMVFFFDTLLSLLILFAVKELIKLAQTNIATYIHIMKKAILTILTGAALAVGSAQAAIVFGNLGANGSDPINSNGGTLLNFTTWRAYAFTPNGADLVLNTATLGLSTRDSGTAVIRLDLYTNIAGSPGTSLFNTSQTVAAGTSALPITFTLNQTLTAGETYWIVAQRDGGTGANNVLNWRPPTPTTTAATEQNGSGWVSVGAKTSSNDGVTWGSLETAAGNAISLTASSPIPEPGTWAAMAIFAGGAAYAGWRRRQQPQMA
jgi:hypothetical protein